MRLDKLIGHDAIVRLLKRLVIRDHVPHALIFEGSPGSGRRTIALALAQALLCQKSDAGDACGNCDACRLMNASTHPDCTILPNDRELADIPLEMVRDQITEQAYISPLMGNRRIFILPEVERLNLAAANVLLKVLEEPPSGTFIFMTTGAAAGLLRTICSRAQLYRLAPLPHEAIARILVSHGVAAAVAQERSISVHNGLRGIEESLVPAPLDELEALCRNGLQLETVASIMGQLPQRVAEDAGKTLASEQRRVLANWLDQLLQRLRQVLRLEPRELVDETCEIIDRVLRLQGDLQRYVSPQVVIEGLALATR
jgi:DNA polymerase III subunit delta'